MDDEIIDENVVRRHILYKTSNHCIMQSLSCELGLEDLYKVMNLKLLSTSKKWEFGYKKWKFESKNENSSRKMHKIDLNFICAFWNYQFI